MKKINLLLLFILSCSILLSNERIFFKFKDESKKITLNYNKGEDLQANIYTKEFNRLITKFGISKIYDPVKTRSKALDVTFAIELTNYKKNFQKLIETLEQYEFIEYAETDVEVKSFHTITDPDFVLNKQWYLTKINAHAAWDTYRATASTTARKVVIAVVDDAILTSHRDLAPVMFKNSSEIGGISGFDDDGNGYIDDTTGWDASSVDNNPNPPTSASNSYFTHGTHVAGLVGAKTDNSIGIASMGYDIQILPIKIGRDSDAKLDSALGGLDYAVNCGFVDVVNMSWGSYSYNQTYQNIINAGHSKGIIFVAAAGNDSTSALAYPASYNHVISVAAGNKNDIKASFSNWGPTIDIVAPGVNIFSTTAGSISSYNSFQGTSMASPIVAGLCGLMVAHSPGISPANVELCIKSTATTNIDALNPSFSGQLGAGRINADLALLCLNGPPIVNITSNRKVICQTQTISFQDVSLGIPATSWEWDFPGGTPATSLSQNPTIQYNTNGNYNVTLIATNSFGSDTTTFINYVGVGTQSATISGNNVINSGDPTTLRFDFTGNPPYTFTYTDGTTNFPSTASSSPHYITIPVVSTSTNYSMISYSDAGCIGTFNGNANIQVNISSNCYDNTNFMNNWYFGNYAGITFDPITRNPSAIPLSSMSTGEGCASISDSRGNPLFYSNGIRAWSASNTQIGVGLGGATNSAQSSIITPVPGDTNLYYIFTVNDWHQTSTNFQYAIYYKANDSVSAAKTITYDIKEQVAATYHQNGTHIWVVVHNSASAGNQFLAYKLDGVTPPDSITPIISTSSVTNAMQYSGYNRHGALKFSHTGDLLASAFGGSRASATNLSSILSIFQFDNNTGVISSELVIESGLGINNYMYSCEFSPDNSVLYATEFNSDSIHRYDLSVLNPATIKSSKKTMYSGVSNSTALQLGPDKKIYVCVEEEKYLNVFNNPNNFSSPNYLVNSVTLNGKGYLGLPNFFTTNRSNDIFKDSTLCNGNYPFSLNATAVGGISNVEWFNGSGISLSTSNTYSISGPGSYYVDRTTTAGCIWRDYFTISNGTAPSLIANDTSFCLGETMQLSSSGTGTVKWYPSASLSNDAINNPIFIGTSSQKLILIRTGINGCITKDSINVFIDSNCCGVIADFYSSDTTICVGSTINFTNTSSTTSTTSPLTYLWNFGTGALPSTSTSTNSSVLFNTTGTHNVTLIASNNCGIDTSYLTINVIGLPDLSSFNDTNICFDSLSGGIQLGSTPISTYNYSWSPSLGLSNPNIANPIYSGLTSQQYTVSVTNNFGCISTKTIQINFIQKPNINIGNNRTFCPGYNLYFSNNATNPATPLITYNWNFGASQIPTSSSLPNPRSIFNTPGVHNVTLSMTNICGTSVDTIEVTILGKPNANIGPNVTICQDDTIIFANTDTNITSYTTSWYFQGGSPTHSTLPNPSVSFSNLGTNLVSLTLRNNCFVTTVTKYVNVLPKPRVNIGPDKTICEGMNITFANSLANSGFPSYNWSFGPGASISSSTLLYPTVTFNTPGTNMVILTMTNSCGSKMDTMYVTVNKKPKANIGANQTICSGATINFADTATNTAAYSYNWNFGAGSGIPNSTSPNPSVTFANAGTFTVTLTMTNTCGTSTATKVITVNQAPAANIGANQTICSGATINFADTATNTAAYSYNWTFGTGSGISSSTSPNPSVTFANAGTFTVTLTMTNTCGTSTATKVVTVNQAPAANIGANQTICEGDIINFSNSAPNPFSSALSYSWNFGTGASPSSSTSPTPSVTFNTAGAYTVSLTLTNSCGTVTVNKVITVNQKPNVNIGPDQTICQGSSINFGNTAGNPFSSSLGYSWNFGPFATPSTSTNPNPIVTFNNPGIHMVTLTMGNDCGESTDTMYVTVNPNPDISGFMDTVICIGPSFPRDIPIGEAPITGYTYNWTPAANLTNPSASRTIARIYSAPATFTVTVTNSYGCMARRTVTITEDTCCPTAVASVNNDSLCLGDSFNFTYGGTKNVSGNLYKNGTLVSPICFNAAQTPITYFVSQNATIQANGDLLKTAGGNSWGTTGVASAMSTQQIQPGEYIEWDIQGQANNMQAGIMIGLSYNPAAISSWNTVDYALYHFTGNYEIYENGGTSRPFITPPIAVNAGDRMRIERNGGNIDYYINCVLVRSTLETMPTNSMRVEIAMWAQGSRVTGLVRGTICGPCINPLNTINFPDPAINPPTYIVGNTISTTALGTGNFTFEIIACDTLCCDTANVTINIDSCCPTAVAILDDSVLCIGDTVNFTYGGGSSTTGKIFKNGTYLSDICFNSQKTPITNNLVQHVTVQSNGDILKTSGGNSWSSVGKARSIQQILDGEYIEFEMKRSSPNLGGTMIGLAYSVNSSSNWQNIDYAFYDYSSNYNIYESGNGNSTLNPRTTGDIMRIERDGGTIRYYINCVPLTKTALESATQLAMPMTVQIEMWRQGASISNLVKGKICGSCNNPLGNINFPDPNLNPPTFITNNAPIPTAGLSPGTYTFQIITCEFLCCDTAEVSFFIDSCCPIAVAILDDTTICLDDSVNFTYGGGPFVTGNIYRNGTFISQLCFNSQKTPITFNSLQNTTVQTNGDLLKTGGGNSWTTSVTGKGQSVQQILPGEFVEWEIQGNSTNFQRGIMMGLSYNIPANSTWNTVDYSLYNYFGNYQIYENGANPLNTGTVTAGDMMRIERNGGNIIYYINCVPIRTVAEPTAQAALPMLVEIVMYAQNSRVHGLVKGRICGSCVNPFSHINFPDPTLNPPAYLANTTITTAGLIPGTYTFEIIACDLICCDTTEVTFVLDTCCDSLQIKYVITSNPRVANPGIVQLNTIGGTGPYTYTLVGGSTNNTGLFKNLAILTTYTFIITDAMGCSKTITIYIPKDLKGSGTRGSNNTTLEEVNLVNNQMKLFPNPTNGRVTISLESTNFSQIEVIHSSSGKTVIRKTLAETTNKTTLDVNSLTTGVYLVKITDENNKQYIMKMIKI